MATFTLRITDLIGSEYTTIASNSVSDLFNAAVNGIADAVPADLLLKYAVNPQDMTTSVWTLVEGKKVLLVTRLDGSGGFNRECRPVSIQDFEMTKDEDSLYFATKHSPAYTYATDAGTTSLEVFPAPNGTEVGKVYYFEYIDSDITGDSTITGFPDELYQAVVLKACTNILQTYVSDFCQDEEDQEMLTMLNGQIQTIQALFQTEMSRYQEADASPRGE